MFFRPFVVDTQAGSLLPRLQKKSSCGQKRSRCRAILLERSGRELVSKDEALEKIWMGLMWPKAR